MSIGKFGKITKILKDHKCKKVLFAGRVRKPHFSEIKLDLKFDYIIATGVIHHLQNPASALQCFEKILKEDGIIYLMILVQTNNNTYN